MTQSIPKPNFPAPRRRSSIGQAALASRAGAAPADTAAETDNPPAPRVVPQDEPQPTQAAKPARVAPAAPSPTETPTPPSGPRARNGGAARSANGAATEPFYKRLGGSKDILLSLPEDLKERMVNTIAWTTPHTGISQQQKFIRKGIADLCERLEGKFNSGKPFPAPASADE